MLSKTSVCGKLVASIGAVVQRSQYACIGAQNRHGIEYDYHYYRCVLTHCIRVVCGVGKFCDRAASKHRGCHDVRQVPTCDEARPERENPSH